MRTLAAVFLFSLTALAIDGTVVNRTTGKPQPGATVTLYQLGQAGMDSIESVKSDAQGKFEISRNVSGPRLIQAAYDGVTYNHMLPPGAPTTGLTVDVYNSLPQPGAAAVAQHMVLLEPSGERLTVSESYIFQNDGTTTYNDPDRGTLSFYLPPEAKGLVQVRATAPKGMPIQRAAEKTERADIYKLDFPIKPGETRIDLTYFVPFKDKGVFEGKLLHKGGATRLVTPAGVTLKGEAVRALGAEPRTQANIYDVQGSAFRVTVEGTGSLRQPETEAQDGGPSIQQIMPRIYKNLAWILTLGLGILALGFLLLYRAQPVVANSGDAREAHGGTRR